MSSHRLLPEAGDAAADPLEGAGAADDAGGDPACWACLVCPECGTVVSEGHRDGCSQFRPSADPPRSV